MRDLHAIFGGNVHRWRRQRRLTQEQLAFEAEIDLTCMGGIERGKQNRPLGATAWAPRLSDFAHAALLSRARCRPYATARPKSA